MVLRILIIVAILLNLSFSTTDALGKSKQEELKGVQRKIKEEKREIKKVEKRERSALSELETIEKTLRQKEEEFKGYDYRLKETEKKIRDIESELNMLQKRIEKEKNILVDRLRVIYKEGRRGYYYGALIGAKDPENLFKRYKYLKTIADQDHRLIDRYMTYLIQLNKDRVSLEGLKENVSSYREKAREKEEEVKAERNKRLVLLSSFRKEKSARKEVINELEEAANRIKTLIKEEDKKEAYRKVETPSIPGIGFSAQKGMLSWPVEGKLIALFGSQVDPEFNTPIFKRGIEIRTKIGDEIKAVYKGSVVYADWFKGYGRLLIINHGDRYYSLYAHASEIFPKVGETVSEGKVVGKVGDTGSFKGPILYFEIRHRGEPVDPLAWLRKK